MLKSNTKKIIVGGVIFGALAVGGIVHYMNKNKECNDFKVSIEHADEKKLLKMMALSSILVKKELNANVIEKAIYCGYDFSTGEMPDVLLGLSVMSNNKKIYAIALDNGANVNVQSNNNETILATAVKAGHVEIVKALIKDGANVNTLMTTKKDGTVPALFFAIKNENVEIVKILLDAGANINTLMTNKKGETLPILFSAIKKANVEIIKTVLDSGVDANANVIIKEAKQEISMPILAIAVMEENLRIMRLLLDAGANPNIAVTRGNETRPLLPILEKRGKTEIVKILIEAGAKR